MIKARRNIGMLAAVAAVLFATFLLPGGMAAASTGPTTTLQVVATGLNAPRGLIYDKANHRLLIAEAGVAAGNTSPCASNGIGTICYGATGSVYSFSLTSNGQTGRIITGLPSFSNAAGNFVQGLEDVALTCTGQILGSFSLSNTVATRTALGPGAADLGQVVAFGPYGQVTPIADVGAFEQQFYGTAAAESAPWGIATGSFGTLITNAEGGSWGGNDVLQLNHGNLTQLVAFPERTVPGVANPIDPTPDTVVQGPDGALYIGELTSFPYPAGSADVWRVVPGQAPTLYATGFSKIIDMAFDNQGRLIVLQNGGRLSPAEVIRVNRDGTQDVLVTQAQGLDAPSSIVVVNSGTYYITNFGGGTGGDGQLLQVTVTDD